MRSLSTPLPENPKSSNWRNEQGFSLLEVVVALTILAGGFLTVLNLFSGSVLSVDLSGQYLKAVTLANSKINELEMFNFQPSEYSGQFKKEKSYRWEIDIAPHDSPLNDPSSGIQLQKILLNVSWEDRGQTRNVELATLHLKGQTYPASDSSLEKLFSGGASSPGSPGEEGETQKTSDTPGSGSSPGSSGVSGASSSVAPPSCPAGQTYIFGAGCTIP
ncbi:MAG: prepilin-type N-terminal cleavage/methylation domain-containing protein [Nitrospinaceae bacterium]|nr:prepilin-type N-terminal cleavage/methylation domain-containing protein [Nitrospinaceae bacterium]